MISPFGHSKDVNEALSHAAHHGWMSREQYSYIADRLKSACTSSALIFGMGHDSNLWARCVSGRLIFVEDDPTYITAAPADSQIMMHRFSTQVGVWAPIPMIPKQIDCPWDCVLVDGPSGYDLNCPGRQIPIAWAREVAHQQIFVHDYERSWEREVCDRYLGAPQMIIPSSYPKRGDLAVFDCPILS
jgi:hypothetical protein